MLDHPVSLHRHPVAPLQGEVQDSPNSQQFSALQQDKTTCARLQPERSQPVDSPHLRDPPGNLLLLGLPAQALQDPLQVGSFRQGLNGQGVTVTITE